MQKICNKSKCNGCTACLNICPKFAISMKEDELGFKYPIIDDKKCIKCDLCKKICPVNTSNFCESFNKTYACYNKDEKVLKSSTSGGIFSLIANYILEQEGVVVGAKFENLELNHVIIDNKNDLRFLRGSKYIQSNLNEIFKRIKSHLKNRKVLFVGTPCQVAGLKFYLKKDYENLYCIDLICHGVPSKKLLVKYIKELENNYNKKVINIDFRNKITGWENYSVLVTFDDNTTMSEEHSVNDYINLFVQDNFLRYSCFECNFKLGNKYSDITLGDFWGIKDVIPEMYNNNGVSSLIINTEKGEKLFKLIKDKVIYKKCNLSDIIKNNYSLERSQYFPKRRKIIASYIDKMSLKELRELNNKDLTLIEKIKLNLKK